MDPCQRESVIDSLFVMAGRDGHISAEEKNLLHRLLLGLGVHRSQIWPMIESRTQNPPQQDTLEKCLPDHPSRLQAMKMLIAVCLGDGVLDPRELDYLYELAVKLGISAEELDSLRVDAEGIVGPLQ